MPGLGIYFLHPRERDWQLNEIVRQIEFTRSIGTDGQAYFRNQFLLDNTKGLLDKLKEQFYAYPAVVPAMKWQDSIAPLPPSQPVFTPLTKGVQLKWKASESREKGGIYYRVYASDTYPVDIQKAENIIATRTDSTTYTFLPDFPWQEKAYWCITAVDRFGNESEALEMNIPVFDLLGKKKEKH